LNRILIGFIAFVVVLVTNQEVRSQDTYNYTQFFVNPSLVNPAYTGIDGQPAAFISYKKQWMGFEGAPTIGSLSVQAPLPSRLSVGLNFSNDKRGLLSTSAFMFSNSYYVPVAPETYVRFGFSLGAAWNKVDVNALNFGSVGDDVLTDLLSSNFTLMGNAGLAFQAKTFQIGVSIPNIFQPAYLSKDAFTVSQVKPFESIILQTSYRYYFSKNKFAFEPTLMYRLNSSIPSQLEAAGVVHMNNVAWVGGSFKQNYGISAMLGLKPSRLSALGYSYTMKNVGINEMNSPSHEIQLAILFGVRNKKIPVYSFVNAEKEKGKKDPTHEKQKYYARNDVKNATTTKGKPKGNSKNTPTQISGPRNRTSDPLSANNTQTNTKAKNNTVAKNTNPTKNPTNPTTNPTNPTTNPTNPTTNPTNPTTNPTNPTTNPTNPTTNPTNPTTNPTNPTTNPTNPTTNPTNPTTNPTNPTTNPTNPTTNPTNPTTNPTNPTTNPTNPTTNPTNPTTNPTNPTTNPTNPTTNPTNPTTNPTNPTTNPTNPTTNPTNPTTNPTNPTTNPNQPVVLTEAQQQQHEEEVINRLEDHADDPTETHDEEHPHAERHEFVRRGDHVSEMDLGDYVIVGVFRSEANAKRVSDGYRNLGFSEVDYGFQSGKNLWFVHIAGSDDIEEARTARNKYRKMKMFKDAWLLTVHQ
jgi:type IX secretion system PorP/SprF family membrane protein